MDIQIYLLLTQLPLCMAALIMHAFVLLVTFVSKNVTEDIAENL